jgi:hypothetical protein
MKTITVVVPGNDTDQALHDLNIPEKTYAADVLTAVEKDPAHFQLQRKQGEAFETVGSTVDLHAILSDGEKIFAVPKDMVVG